MAAHLGDTILHGRDHPDTHASSNRWRHQESGSYAKHASEHEGDGSHDSKDLADFFNSSRVEPKPTPSGPSSGPKHQPIPVGGTQGTQNGGWTVECGPLLNYRRMENETWFGSVLIVTRGGGAGESPAPELILKIGGGVQAAKPVQKIEKPEKLEEGTNSEHYGIVNGVDYTNFQDPASKSELPQGRAPTHGVLENGASYSISGAGETNIKGIKLYSDPLHTFWRFDLQVPMQEAELHCEYSIPGLTFSQGTKTDKQSFFVPSKLESMRVMFHSCNGFSVGTDEEAWSGPALWNDVLRVHKKTPFHVM
jgi:hypothetical protein